MLGVEVFPLEYQMAIIAVYRISWPARKPSFHSFKAVAFKLPRNVQCICPSGMAALDSGAPVNGNWTTGACSFFSSACHSSIHAVKAVNIHVETSASYLSTWTQ